MTKMLRRTLGKIVKGQKGQVLPIVLILLVIGGLLIVPTLNYASTSLKGHEVVESNTLEFYAADSGIEDALHWIMQGREAEGSWDGWDETGGFGARDTYYLNGRSVDVTVDRMEEMGNNYYKITSEATTEPGSTTVLSIVWISDVDFIDGDLPLGHGESYPGSVFVDGNIMLDRDAIIEGDAYATGSIILNSDSQIGGNVCADGDITLNSDSRITGGVSATGSIILNSDSQIWGDVCAAGDITLNNRAVIESNAYATGNITLYGNAQIKGNVSAAEDITLYGYAVIGGNAYATGNIMLDSNAVIGGSSNPHWKNDLPVPECPQMPEMPESPAKIITWEIT